MEMIMGRGSEFQGEEEWFSGEPSATAQQFALAGGSPLYKLE
jgi:hypothetical protein